MLHPMRVPAKPLSCHEILRAKTVYPNLIAQHCAMMMVVKNRGLTTQWRAPDPCPDVLKQVEESTSNGGSIRSAVSGRQTKAVKT